MSESKEWPRCSARKRHERDRLEEKNGRAQIKKCEKNFFLVWRASASGGGAERQFRSKKVRAFSNKAHQIGLRDFLWGEAEICSPRRTARRANYRFGFQKIRKSSLVLPTGVEPVLHG